MNPGSPTYPHNLNTQLGTIGFLEISGGQRRQPSGSYPRGHRPVRLEHVPPPLVAPRRLLPRAV